MTERIEQGEGPPLPPARPGRERGKIERKKQG